MTFPATNDRSPNVGGPPRTSGPAVSRDRLNLLEEIARSRRSVYSYTAEMPPRAVIDRAFRIAILAPNHYRTNPWRFFAFAAQRRAPLAAAYERAAARLGRDVARARQRALDAPLMIVVGCIPSTATPRVKAAEETFATAAAIQNLLLAFAAAGVATLITTGDLALSQEVNDLVRLPEQGGSVMAVVNAGYIDPAGRVAPRPELELDQFVSWFDGSETASPPA